MTYYKLQMNITQGAGSIDQNFPALSPSNIATIYGSPGASLVATINNDAEIIEAEFGTTYQFQLDEDGYGQFHIVQRSNSTVRSAISVIVFDQNSPDSRISQYTYFMPYRIGTGHLQAYNYTTDAPNDGKTPCCLSVLVNQTTDIGQLKTIIVRTERNSSILNSVKASDYTTLPIDDQGCVTVQLVNKINESDTVTIALPQSPDGEYIQAIINFNQFPN